ncbi:hypothetical protein KJ810_00735 [Patescibacteria group bacterium]|nr:hypothetical protein [Patescibacteria group bacterium]
MKKLIPMWSLLIVVGLLVVSGVFNVVQHNQQAQTEQASIPVLALSQLAESEQYHLEAFRSVSFTQNGYTNDAYLVLVSTRQEGQVLPGYNGFAGLVVSKQLVDINPAASDQVQTATVATVVSEGNRTRILCLCPTHVRPDPAPNRDLQAALAVHTK